ncbi:Uncharacterised protein [Enterobacter cloacae]|nr:Uncharacterised protein [Enterobacter cloacae]
MIELAAQLQNTGDVQTYALRLLQFVISAGVRDHDRDPVALLHLQRIGNAFAHDDLLLASLKVCPCAILHIARQRTQTLFLTRIYPFHLNGAQVYPALYQPGKVDVRCSRRNAGHLFHFVKGITPVGPRLVSRLDFTVGDNGQNAVIQFTLKAVHGA